MKRDEFSFLDKTHEFCDKEIAALDAIVKELKEGINAALDSSKYKIDNKLRLILLRKLFKAQRLMETYWMDAKPKKKRKRRPFSKLAWAGIRREKDRI